METRRVSVITFIVALLAIVLHEIETFQMQNDIKNLKHQVLVLEGTRK